MNYFSIANGTISTRIIVYMTVTVNGNRNNHSHFCINWFSDVFCCGYHDNVFKSPTFYIFSHICDLKNQKIISV